VRKKTKKKHKKRHYKTGIHHSDKCANGPVKYRSGWELTVCVQLDNDPKVISYEYEPLQLEYVSNKRTQRKRIYIPDFLIVYCNKTKKLVEVKRKKQLNNKTVIKKAKVARLWCRENKAKYEFWTDKQIFAFQKIQKQLEKASAEKTLT
jgi:hypothetical protein